MGATKADWGKSVAGIAAIHASAIRLGGEAVWEINVGK